MIKLVIIDIDDTLTPTEHIWFEVENRVAKKLGLPLMDRKTYQERWGTPLKESIEKRVPGGQAQTFIEEIRKITPELVAKGETDVISPANLKTLDDIKALGKKLAILTSRELFEMEHFLDENHALAKTIDAFYYRDNSPCLKPDPRVFDQILEHFQVKPDEAVYIGDTLNDALCAKKAGLHFIAVLESGLKKREDFAHLPVDFFADAFPDVLKYIKTH